MKVITYPDGREFTLYFRQEVEQLRNSILIPLFTVQPKVDPQTGEVHHVGEDAIYIDQAFTRNRPESLPALVVQGVNVLPHILEEGYSSYLDERDQALLERIVTQVNLYLYTLEDEYDPDIVADWDEYVDFDNVGDLIDDFEVSWPEYDDPDLGPDPIYIEEGALPGELPPQPMGSGTKIAIGVGVAAAAGLGLILWKKD